jgi:hypothetical protein
MTSKCRLTLVALALILSAAASVASANPDEKVKTRPVPSRARVLAAVDLLLRDPVADKMRPEFPLIYDFADKSPDVEIVLGTPYFEFGKDKRLNSILLAYFIAGAVKFDLENPVAARNPQADAGPAIRAALVYYRVHRRAHPKDTVALFEKYDSLDKQGKLDEFIASQPPAADEH